MQRESYIQSIENKLSLLLTRVKLRGRLNLLDLNIHSENFFRDLLNLIYDYDLKNLNNFKSNAEGIDLIDNTNKVIFQVTSTATTTKINSSIEKLTEVYQGYNLKFMIIVDQIPKLFSKAHPVQNKYICFNPKIDIIDIGNILKEISDCDIERLEKIYKFFKSEIILEGVKHDDYLGEKNNHNQILSEAYQYNKNAYSEISILSVPEPIDIQNIWIPLEATVVSDEENENLNLDATVERYQNWYKEKRHDGTLIDSFTFGRFIKKCVVIGGAGIGKTTLFRKLALDYSDEGYFVLFVRLSKLTDMLLDSSIVA